MADKKPIKPNPLGIIFFSLSINLLLLIAWIVLFWPVLGYLAVIFSREEFRTNQILLLAVIALIASQVRRHRYIPHLTGRPHLFWPALILALAGSTAYLVVERWLDINMLSATLFGLASYGLLGLWLHPAAWRAGLPAALLLIGALPFGEHLQTFIGYPLRILTAEMVRSGLAKMGVPSLSIDTILVFENGLSQVDLPCSGVKSLWTGSLFYLAATWIEQRRINLGWLLAGVIFAGLLMIANLARVAVLVSVGQVLNWRLLAEMLHVPLGVLGFTGACLAALYLLRWLSGRPVQPTYQSTSTTNLTRPAWLAPLLCATTVLMLLVYTPLPQSRVAAKNSQRWLFPSELVVEPWRFGINEQKWIDSNGAQSVIRWRFRWEKAEGSMLVVVSNSWRSQHRPERCFLVYGLETKNSYPILLQPDFPIRVVSLARDSQESLYSAAYWFQSSQRITEDYGARIWADLQPHPQTWVLVTILFDGQRDPADPELAGLYLALRRSVNMYLLGE